MSLHLLNPIPNAIADPAELGRLFGKYGIIPYYGTTAGTSHSMLNLLADLSLLSPSHQACKDDIKTYAFPGYVDLVRRAIPGLVQDDVKEVSMEEKTIFYDNFLLANGITLPGIVEATREMYDSITDSGNAYLRIRISELGDSRSVTLTPLHFRHCAYLRTKKKEDRIIIYTKKWDESYWKEVPPEIIPVSYLNQPFVWQKRGNTVETILHIRNKADGSDFYGRPKILSVLYYMFVEWTQSDLAVKTGSTEFVSKMLLAFEERDPARKLPKGETQETLFRKQMLTLRALTTNEGGIGDSKTLAGIEYPHGGKTPVPINLQINRDVSFTESQIRIATAYIYALHKWDRQLTGFEGARSNIGGNILIDLFTVKNIGTILPLQKDWATAWGNILQEICAKTGYNREIYGIEYPNLISTLVEQLRGGKTQLNTAISPEENV